MHSWKKYDVKIFEMGKDGKETVKEKIRVLASSTEHAFNLAGAKLAEREKQALINKHVEEVI